MRRVLDRISRAHFHGASVHRAPLSLLVLGSLLLAVAACGAGTDLADDLAGSEYWSTSVTENGAERALVAGTRIVLQFRDDTISAGAGCNTMGGGYSIDDGRLATTDLSMTEMGCDAERHAQDQFVSTMLSAKPTVEIDGDILRLTTGSATIEFLDAAIANPARPLTGTTWEIDGFLSGGTASTFSTEVQARLTIGEDSIMQLFDGCADTTLPVSFDENEIRFEPTGVPPVDRCDAPAGYRESIYAALSRGVVAYAIDGASLTVTTPDLVGFTAQARE